MTTPSILSSKQSLNRGWRKATISQAPPPSGTLPSAMPPHLPTECCQLRTKGSASRVHGSQISFKPTQSVWLRIASKYFFNGSVDYPTAVSGCDLWRPGIYEVPGATQGAWRQYLFSCDYNSVENIGALPTPYMWT